MRLHSKLLFLFLLAAIACDKDNEKVNDCSVSAEVTSLYQEDVHRLLFREIYYDSLHPDRDTPEFNDQKVEKLLEAFQAVHNLNSIYRDTVVEIYQIHTFQDLGLSTISLQVNPESEHIISLLEDGESNDPVLDGLLKTYEFTEIKPSLYYPEFNWLTIISDKSWNLIPICETLSSLEYIGIAELGGGAVGDGNNIVLQRTDNKTTFDFSIGWGDCPAGCIYRRHWIFEVNNNCSVEFVDSYTD